MRERKEAGVPGNPPEAVINSKLGMINYGIDGRVVVLIDEDPNTQNVKKNAIYYDYYYLLVIDAFNLPTSNNRTTKEGGK